MHESERNGRIFGQATLIGDHADEHGFFDEGRSTQDKALDMAWSHACVIAEQLTDPSNATYGPDLMLKRYGETNFWFGYVLAESAKINPELHTYLSLPVPRQEDEPVGNFEPQSVPESHVTEMSPMSRIYGYAIPRVHIEAMGRGATRNQERALKAMGALDQAIKTTTTPAELLAELTGKAVELGADPKELLSHVLPAGVLEEEHCYTDYEEIFVELSERAEDVFNTYVEMPDDEKITLRIVTTITNPEHLRQHRRFELTEVDITLWNAARTFIQDQTSASEAAFEEALRRFEEENKNDTP